MEYLDLAPYTRALGSIRLPGSKSISNRTLLLAALANGETVLHGLLDSDDTQRMLEALRALGVKVEIGEDFSRVYVQGVNGVFTQTEAELFLGNAGTAFRPLTAALAMMQGHYILKGVPRMHERPIGDLVDGLRCLGANIEYLGQEGFPPLKIGPRQQVSGNSAELLSQVRGDVSSQFLTALLMAMPLSGEDCKIEVLGELISKPYIEITLNLMRRFGAQLERHDWAQFKLPAQACYQSPGSLHVEGDASSASYFLAAGVLGGGPLRVEGVGRNSIQGDVRFAETLAQMGGLIAIGEDWIEASGSRIAQGGRLKALDADLNHIPDAAMTLAVLALFADGPSCLRNIGSWRVKETDRLSAMAIELRKLGAQVEEGADFLRITPPLACLPNVAIDTYDDHRMAMCFSLLSVAGVPVRINDPKCVGKTFPDYFKVLASVLGV